MPDPTPQTEQGLVEKLRGLADSAYLVDEFLRSVLSWAGSDEDELSAAIEENEKVCAALSQLGKDGG